MHAKIAQKSFSLRHVSITYLTFSNFKFYKLKNQKIFSNSFTMSINSSSSKMNFENESSFKSIMDELSSKNLLKSKCYIGGNWSDAINQNTIPVLNPFNNEVITEIPFMGKEETKLAISEAEKSFKEWSKTTVKYRSKLLRDWYNLIILHKNELANLMTLEQGKPLKESLAEIEYGGNYIEFYSEEAKRIYGDVLPSPSLDKKIFVLKQPVGVVGIITPWNFPIAMITRKVAPALAAGCTVVIKPSEFTPLSALALAELATQANIPSGVINVITGDAADIGNILLKNDDVKKISFTGSTLIGKKLYNGSSDTLKKLSLELGGNAPFIIFEDADLALAAKGTFLSKFRNSGQTCICANRIFVHDSIYELFMEEFSSHVQKLKLGNGLDENTTIGPLINSAAVEKVERLVNDAISKGAKVILGGKRSDVGNLFFQPTILTNINKEMDIYREEVFGPVAPIFRFSNEKEVIELANDTEYGLAAYFYTENISKSWRVCEKLKFGMVGVNEGQISTEFAPFGGIKHSGFGREGSKYGLEGYLEMKYMCLGNLS